MYKLIDLSHPIENGMTTFEGQPGPIIEEYATRGTVFDEKFRFASDTRSPPGNQITLVDSTGTIIDSPFYHSDDGCDIAQMPLSILAAIETIVLRRPVEEFGRATDADAFEDLDITGKAVLIDTGWCRHWRNFRYFKGWPYLTEEAAHLLAERKAKIVGIDSLNIDITDDGRRPVHAVLLARNIPIVSHMSSLSEVPGRGALFFATPLKVIGFSVFPVRAFCMVSV